MPDYPIKQGGHRIQPHPDPHRQPLATNQEWTCVDCHTTGPHGLFNVIGQLDYCPEVIESMNGYLSVDPAYTNQGLRGTLAKRCALQWHDHARRAGYAIKDWRFLEGDGHFCAVFTWRGQHYRLRYGLDRRHGITHPGGVNAEPAPDNWEPTRL